MRFRLGYGGGFARAAPGGLLAMALFALGACASPNLQHAVLSAVEQGAEPKPDAQRALAARAREGVLARYPISSDAETQARLRDMARKLGRAADPRGIFTYEVVLLESDQPMLFSAGDGTIYVTTRVPRLLTADDQMAFAIAHEIAHVVRGDPVAGFTAGADPASEAVRIAHRGYAPHVESLADQLALEYLLAAGFNPEQGARALRTMTGYQRRVDRFGTLMHGSAARKRQRTSILSHHMPQMPDPEEEESRDEAENQPLRREIQIDDAGFDSSDAVPELNE